MTTTVEPVVRPMTADEAKLARALQSEMTEGVDERGVAWPHYADDLAAGQVAVYRFTTTRAVRLTSGKAEFAPRLVLDIGDDRVLYLSGPALIEPLGEANFFPCRAFEVIRLPRSQVLAITCQGEPLPEVETLTEVAWDRLPDAHFALLDFPYYRVEEALRAQDEEEAVSPASLPKEVREDLRAHVRKCEGSYTLSAVAATAVLCFGVPIYKFAIATLNYYGIRILLLSKGNGVFDTKSFYFLIFAVLGIVMIRSILQERWRRYSPLLLAGETMHSGVSVQVPVTIRAHMDTARNTVRYTATVLFPLEFAWEHRLPAEMEVSVPDGDLDAEIRRRPEDDLHEDVFSETATVYLGRAGSVVVATSRGLLVRAD